MPKNLAGRLMRSVQIAVPRPGENPEALTVEAAFQNTFDLATYATAWGLAGGASLIPIGESNKAALEWTPIDGLAYAVPMLTSDSIEGTQSFGLSSSAAAVGCELILPIGINPLRKLFGEVWLKLISGAVTLGVRCYSKTGQLLGTRPFLAAAAIPPFNQIVNLFGVLSGEGLGAGRFPSATRVVKLYIVLDPNSSVVFELPILALSGRDVAADASGDLLPVGSYLTQFVLDAYSPSSLSAVLSGVVQDIYAGEYRVNLRRQVEDFDDTTKLDTVTGNIAWANGDLKLSSPGQFSLALQSTPASSVDFGVPVGSRQYNTLYAPLLGNAVYQVFNLVGANLPAQTVVSQILTIPLTFGGALSSVGSIALTLDAGIISDYVFTAQADGSPRPSSPNYRTYTASSVQLRVRFSADGASFGAWSLISTTAQGSGLVWNVSGVAGASAARAIQLELTVPQINFVPSGQANIAYEGFTMRLLSSSTTLTVYTNGGTYTTASAISKGYDLGASPIYTAPAVSSTLNGGTILLEYSDSADNVSFGAWTPTITTLTRRYLRFRATLTPGTPYQTPVLARLELRAKDVLAPTLITPAATLAGTATKGYFLELLTQGNTSGLKVEFSADGGTTWTVLTRLTLTTLTASGSSGRIRLTWLDDEMKLRRLTAQFAA